MDVDVSCKDTHTHTGAHAGTNVLSCSTAWIGGLTLIRRVVHSERKPEHCVFVFGFVGSNFI